MDVCRISYPSRYIKIPHVSIQNISYPSRCIIQKSPRHCTKPCRPSGQPATTFGEPSSRSLHRARIPCQPVQFKIWVSNDANVCTQQLGSLF